MIRFYLALLLTLGTLTARIAPANSSERLTIIVNAKNPKGSISENELSDYFFKRKRTWPNGLGVRFVDRASGSEIRKTFLDQVLEQSSEQIDLFWIGQKLYSGDSAPLQESSDSVVIQFVSSFEGAISYIFADSPPKDDGVKVLPILRQD